MEDSCVLIQGRSVEEVPEGVEVPELKGWRNGRMDVKAFRAKIEVLSPTSARTSIVANVDPKAPVPQTMVNFVVREPFPAPEQPLKIGVHKYNVEWKLLLYISHTYTRF